MIISKDKNQRILHIYTKLTTGQIVNKSELATYFGVTPKSIQRDIEDVREYLETNVDTLGFSATIEYNRVKNWIYVNTLDTKS